MEPVPPRWAGCLAAIGPTEEFIPMNQRDAVPFDGLERLAWYQGKRNAEATKRRLRDSRMYSRGSAGRDPLPPAA